MRPDTRMVAGWARMMSRLALDIPEWRSWWYVNIQIPPEWIQHHLHPQRSRYGCQLFLRWSASFYALRLTMPRHHEVLERRCGLITPKPQTLRKVGEEIPREDGREGPILKERIRQMEAKALNWLRHPARGLGLPELTERYLQWRMVENLDKLEDAWLTTS